MKRGWSHLVPIIISCLLLLYGYPAWCTTESGSKRETSKKCLKQVALLTGYGSESIEKGHYEVVPVLIQFHFDINPFVQKMGLKRGGDFTLIVEPLFNTVINPDTNVEVGISFLVRYENNIAPKIKWFFEGGVGALYTSQHTDEQGVKYGFLPQGGVGVEYLLTKRMALTGAYRYRHMSNAGTASDNHGLNHNFALIGLTYLLE